MKPLRTWALIADGARARILENGSAARGEDHHRRAGSRADAEEWSPVEGLVFEGGNSSTHDLVSDRQGRSFSPAGSGRSAIEARVDPHREQKTRFAHHLAQVLADRLQAGEFHRLIIAAPPAMLGDLRSAISGKVSAAVIAEFAHDLTKIPNHDIAGHLVPIPV